MNNEHSYLIYKWLYSRLQKHEHKRNCSMSSEIDSPLKTSCAWNFSTIPLCSRHVLCCLCLRPLLRNNKKYKTARNAFLAQFFCLFINTSVRLSRLALENMCQWVKQSSLSVLLSLPLRIYLLSYLPFYIHFAHYREYTETYIDIFASTRDDSESNGNLKF